LCFIGFRKTFYSLSISQKLYLNTFARKETKINTQKSTQLPTYVGGALILIFTRSIIFVMHTRMYAHAHIYTLTGLSKQASSDALSQKKIIFIYIIRCKIQLLGDLGVIKSNFWEIWEA